MIQKAKLTYIILQTMLIVVKTTGTVSWSWWLILFPTLLPIGAVTSLFVLGALIVGLCVLIEGIFGND